jgi:hypothetical protein
MEPTIDHPAVHVLLSFLSEMNAWENEMNRLLSAHLGLIFSEFPMPTQVS